MINSFFEPGNAEGYIKNARKDKVLTDAEIYIQAAFKPWNPINPIIQNSSDISPDTDLEKFIRNSFNLSSAENYMFAYMPTQELLTDEQLSQEARKKVDLDIVNGTLKDKRKEANQKKEQYNQDQERSK